MIDVRAERIKKLMSQKRLAQIAGVDPRTLRKIEKNETVSVESLRAVCKALGLEPSKQKDDEYPQSKYVEQILDKDRVEQVHFGFKQALCASIYGLVALCSPILILDYYSDKRDFFSIEINVSGMCGDETEDRIAEQVRKTLWEAEVANTNIVYGTKDCKVNIDVRMVGKTQKDVIEKLKSSKFDAKIVGFYAKK